MYDTIRHHLFRTLGPALLALASVSAPQSAAASLPHVGIDALLAPPLEGKVNLNEASAAQLELLPGIGPAMAAKILDYRARHPFKQPLHVLRIKGIGRKTYDKIKDHLSVSGPSDLRVAQ